jgi:CheY-like chemotaxis protein
LVFTVLRCTLLLHIAACIRPSESSISKTTATMTSKYVAYVDDDEDDRFVAEEVFEQSSGCALKLFESGRSFLRYLDTLEDRDAFPQLVVLDVNMPGLNGWEVLQLIRGNERYRHLPVVLFSTARAFSFLEQIKAGNVRFYTKPLTYLELRKVWKVFADGFTHNGQPA